MFNYHNELNPQVNALKGRAYYIPFNVEEVSDNREESKQLKMLSNWKFKYFEDISDEVFLSDGEKDIPVPAMWQYHGYGNQEYINHKYPFPYMPPKIYGKIACGVYTTEVMLDKQNKQYLVFEGVDSALYLFVNGEFVGYSSISHNISEFDITPFITEKKTKIKVVVLQRNVGSYLEDQDMFRMNGIFREVYVLTRPIDHIFDYKVKALASGKIEISLDKKATVKLYDTDGKFLAVKTGAKVSFTVKNPKLWSAETPNLYKAVISYNGEFICEYIGLRTIEIKDRVFYLNGQAIKFKGVNRHSSTVNGYVETVEDLIKDLKIMKEHNVNAIRTSHYPPHPLLPLLCDKYGIYLMVEADIEAHGVVWQTSQYNVIDYDDIANNTDFYPQMERRVLNMCERDKNRPSVLIWSLGNEAGWGRNFEDIAIKLKKLDDRPIHYENSYNVEKCHDLFAHEKVLDVYSRMYATTGWMDKFVNSLDCDRPLVLCEYSHAMGNSCGDVFDYWKLIYSREEFMGGFIWEYTDHGIKTEKGFLYGGDNGEEIHDGNFCVDGVVSPDRKSHSSFEEIKKTYENLVVERIGNKLKITSRNYFANLNGDFIVTVKEAGKIVSEKVFALNIAPFKSTTVSFDPVKTDGYSAVYYSYVTSRDEGLLAKGTELAKGFFELSPYKFVETSGRDFEYTLDEKSGKITAITVNGKNILVEPIEINVLRAFTDNEVKARQRWLDYRIRNSFQMVESISKDGNITVVKGYYGAKVVPPYLGYVLTLTKGQGYLDIDLSYRTDFKLGYLPRVGLKFALKNQSNVEYLGMGDGESYIDKMHYTVKDVFNFNPSTLECPYIRPQEYGSHYNTEYVKLNDIEIYSKAPMSFSAVPYSVDELIDKKHDFELEKDGKTHVNIDASICGVGSTSCGPELDEKYETLRAGKLSFRLIVK